MASITIRNLADSLKAQLRLRAAQHNCSMEEEARDILRTALAQEHQPVHNLGKAIVQRFAPFGGVDLPNIKRELLHTPRSFN
jgi:plasmid stability protein